MAGTLSGTFTTSVGPSGSKFKLITEWSATQNITTNKSTVTISVYLTNPTAVGDSSAPTKTGEITLVPSTGGSYTQTATSSYTDRITAGQKKLLLTTTKTFTHQTTGALTIELRIRMPFSLTYGSVTSTNASANLSIVVKDIVQPSKLSGNLDFVIGAKKALTITRSASTLTHSLVVKDGSTTIYSASGIGTSHTVDLSKANIKAIYNRGREYTGTGQKYRPITYQLTTKNSDGVTVGSTQTYTADLLTLPESRIRLNNSVSSREDILEFKELSAGFLSDATLSLSTPLSGVEDFTHNSSYSIDFIFHAALEPTDERFYLENELTLIGLEQSYRNFPIFDLLSYSDLRAGFNNGGTTARITVSAYVHFDDVLFARKDFVFKIKAELKPPIFTISNVVVSDTSGQSTVHFGDDQTIIENLSNLAVKIGTAATALEGAVIDRYEIEIPILNKFATTSAVNTFVSFGKVVDEANNIYNIPIFITAIDSNGSKTTVEIVQDFINYQYPRLEVDFERYNEFELPVTLNFNGVVDQMYSSSGPVNLLEEVKYRYRKLPNGTFSSYRIVPTQAPGAGGIGGGGLGGNNGQIGLPVQPQDGPFFENKNPIQFPSTLDPAGLDPKSDWEFEFSIKEYRSTPTIIKAVLPSAFPIVFIDSDKSSVGFGGFPEKDNEVYMGNTLRFPKDTYLEGNGGAIDLANSDIIGVNGIFMHDVTNTPGEGINFVREGYGNNPQLLEAFDRFSIRYGLMHLNGTQIHNNTIWTGAYQLNPNTESRIPIDMSEYHVGIVLVWSRFSGGSSANTNWNFTLVPKSFSGFTAGGLWAHLMYSGGNTCHKYVYVTDTEIYGTADNGTSPNSNMVLRRVIAV